MIEYGFANVDMIPDLINLYKVCFNESLDSIKFFFNKKFRADYCIVCTVNGKIASTLCMLPANIIKGKKTLPIHYIYAAATMPEYRNNGYMRALLEYSDKIGHSNGVKYSALLPANKDLYTFYEKLGYHSFFKVRNVEINSSDIVKTLYGASPKSESLPISEIHKLRNRAYTSQGYVLWDEKSIEYAVDLVTSSGGKIVFSEKGYALCVPLINSKVEITELVCLEDSLSDLLAGIYAEFPNETYKIRLPVNSKWFKNQGEIKQFGMIKSLRIFDFFDMNCPEPPYIGLTLD